MKNRRKIEPKEIPSRLIHRLLVVFTRQLEILVTTLNRWDFFPACSEVNLGLVLLNCQLVCCWSVGIFKQLFSKFSFFPVDPYSVLVFRLSWYTFVDTDQQYLKACFVSTKIQICPHYFYVTNRFHVAVRLFSNRSQMTSKCRKNKEVAHEPQASVSLLFLPHFDILCDILLNRAMATWNLFVLYNDQKRKRPIHIPASNRLTFWGFVLV